MARQNQNQGNQDNQDNQNQAGPEVLTEQEQAERDEAASQPNLSPDRVLAPEQVNDVRNRLQTGQNTEEEVATLYMVNVEEIRRVVEEGDAYGQDRQGEPPAYENQALNQDAQELPLAQNPQAEVPAAQQIEVSNQGAPENNQSGEADAAPQAPAQSEGSGDAQGNLTVAPVVQALDQAEQAIQEAKNQLNQG